MDKNKQHSWPLPPASVFKCKPAKPWINPDLFYVDHSFNPLELHDGILIVGDVLLEQDEEQENPSDLNGESKSSSNFIKILRRRIEYSNDREIGIDPGDKDESLKENAVKVVRKESKKQSKRVEWADGRSQSAAQINRTESQIKKKKRWSPFQRDTETQTWKLCY